VHGGAHGAWCWTPTVQQLSTPALAVDLPPKRIRRGGEARFGQPPELETLTIADFAASVVADLDAAGLDHAVLIGHSMGGLSIAEVAQRVPARVAHLVFVSCIVPPEGGTAFDAMPDDVADLTDGATETVGTEDAMGLSEARMRHMFCNDMDEVQTRYVLDHTGNEAVKPLFETVTRAGIPASIPITYVRLARDQSLPPDNQDLQIRHLAESPGGEIEVIDLDSGHDVMISRPDLLAPVLDEIAAR
jgi:pimeloyl-ACP methyl ester carboxylesterase